MYTDLNNANICGKHVDHITVNDLFNVIKKIYNFKESYEKLTYDMRRIFIIDDANKAIYWTWNNEYYIGDAEPIYKEEWDYSTQTYARSDKIESYNITNKQPLKDFVKTNLDLVNKWIDSNIDKELYDQELNKLKEERVNNPQHYYELECCDDKWLKLYLENRMGEQNILIESGKEGMYMEIDGLAFDMRDDKTMLDVILNFVLLNKDLFGSFSKIDNGYVFNNVYYAKLDEVMFDIKDNIEKKRLVNKLQNEGLTISDLQEDK